MSLGSPNRKRALEQRVIDFRFVVVFGAVDDAQNYEGCGGREERYRHGDSVIDCEQSFLGRKFGGIAGINVDCDRGSRHSATCISKTVDSSTVFVSIERILNPNHMPSNSAMSVPAPERVTDNLTSDRCPFVGT